jgi:hypothetical protein
MVSPQSFAAELDSNIAALKDIIAQKHCMIIDHIQPRHTSSPIAPGLPEILRQKERVCVTSHSHTGQNNWRPN